MNCPNGAGNGGFTWGTGIAVDANSYFYLVGETEAGELPTTAGVIQPTSGPLGSGGTYVEALARLHCQIQSRHFQRWSIAGLRHLPGRAHCEA